MDSKFPPILWAEPPDLLFPYAHNGAESYHSHLNAEFYVKHPNIYVFVDVLKKIQRTAYVSMHSMSQQARKSKYEREKTAFVVSAYFDYRTQHITRKEFLKKVCSMRFYTLLSCGFIHYSNAFSSSINAFS